MGIFDRDIVGFLLLLNDLVFHKLFYPKALVRVYMVQYRSIRARHFRLNNKFIQQLITYSCLSRKYTCVRKVEFNSHKAMMSL